MSKYEYKNKKTTKKTTKKNIAEKHRDKDIGISNQDKKQNNALHDLYEAAKNNPDLNKYIAKLQLRDDAKDAITQKDKNNQSPADLGKTNADQDVQKTAQKAEASKKVDDAEKKVEEAKKSGDQQKITDTAHPSALLRCPVFFAQKCEKLRTRFPDITGAQCNHHVAGLCDL